MTGRRSLLPFVSVALGIASFSMMDATMKSAALQAGVYSALLLRNAIGSALMLPVWLLAGRRWPRVAVLKVHALRAAVVAVMAVLFFWGLVRIPMAEAIAISFIAPLIALFFAAVLLGELIRPSAIAASLLGLAGMLVIGAARLGQGAFEPESTLGIAAILASAVFYALNLVLQRHQALLADPIEIALFQSLLVGLFLLPAAAWYFAWPEARAWRDITAGAMLAVMSLLLLSWGYARAETQALVPIEYTGFLWAALFGWLWFGETVSPSTVAGAVLIVAACWMATRNPTAQTAV